MRNRPRNTAWRASSWRTYGTLVAAAVASIATSPPSWVMDAKLPAETSSPPPGMAYRYLAEASERVAIDVERPTSARIGDWRQVPPHPTRVELSLFPGERLTRVFTSGSECGGGCGGDCDPPDGAFVRVSEPTPWPAWSLRHEHEVTIGHYGSRLRTIDVGFRMQVARWVPPTELVPGGPPALRFEAFPVAARGGRAARVSVRLESGTDYLLSARDEGGDDSGADVDSGAGVDAGGGADAGTDAGALGDAGADAGTDAGATNDGDRLGRSTRWRIVATLEGLCEREHEPCAAPKLPLAITSIIYALEGNP
ncbi:hypothetical protein [Pendulispora albinea]|uniref:Uncharacterized protein n=1 Tax=Pendulispora albinea TaxID=2741071 RepID=A0ABZ2M4H8_9BACT